MFYKVDYMESAAKTEKRRASIRAARRFRLWNGQQSESAAFVGHVRCYQENSGIILVVLQRAAWREAVELKHK